ncbi:MAG: SEL1-like repeat protein [Betaproteobacteria bacterium]|nr:SEL1-like repeat protein [Betaproteobacteria bacterium]MDE2055954.1 SEL1-like repeat protein [Betaproteobacteria bacterium]
MIKLNLITLLFLIFVWGINNSAYAGYMESKQAFLQHDYSKAYQQCIDSATRGNRDCQNAIGFLYRQGLAVPKDSQEAQKWFLLAAQQDLASAQYNLAVLFGSGELGKTDLQTQAMWMTKAAIAGLAKAQNNLGTFYSQGMGVIQSDQDATQWWRKAAEQNQPMAENNLGWAYATGRGVAMDPLQAQYWLQKAVDQQQDSEAKRLAQNNLINLGLLPSLLPPVNNTLPLQVDISAVDSLGNVKLTITAINQLPITLLKINGQEVNTNNKANLSLARYVSVGDSYMDIYAQDTQQHHFSKQYLVHRTVDNVGTELPLLNPQQVPLAKRQDAVAIIIGAQQYTQLPQSEFSDNDARSFYDYAVRGLGVAPEKVKLLTGTDASRSNILLTLKNWLAAEVNKGNTKVYVYYSGHGLASFDGKKRYLLPVDTNVSLLEDTAISQNQLINIIETYQPSSLTLFLDSCYSGRTKTGNTLLTAMRPIMVYSDIEVPPKDVTIFSSSKGDQLSGVSVSAQHGIFSYYLMRGMQGEADANHDHNITAEELYRYVEQHVSKESIRQGLEQTPVVVGNVNEVIIYGQ